MNLKHQIEALKIERDSFKKESSALKQDLMSKDKDFIRLKQYAKTAMINAEYTSHEEHSKLVMKLKEQKEKIKGLELRLQEEGKGGEGEPV